MRQCPTGGKGLGDLRIRQAHRAYRQGRLKSTLSLHTNRTWSDSPGSMTSAFSGISWERDERRYWLYIPLMFNRTQKWNHCVSEVLVKRVSKTLLTKTCLQRPPSNGYTNTDLDTAHKYLPSPRPLAASVLSPAHPTMPNSLRSQPRTPTEWQVGLISVSPWTSFCRVQ